MALPFPHGVGPGDIAETSAYDTTGIGSVATKRFIGVGEDLTSAIANRPHWALSENIDYLYQVISADRALPAEHNFTAAGATPKVQLSGEVWVATPAGSYPVVKQDGLNILFSVLDADFNELIDPITGEQVYVEEVKDAGEVATVYKTPADGFEPNPYVYFGSGGISYPIPNLTVVNVMYGLRGAFETMPTDTFLKRSVQFGEEFPAEGFRHDGSIPMTGDLDMDGNDVTNVNDISNVSGVTMQIISDNTLNLQDSYLAAPLSLSQTGETGLLSPSGYKISIIGALNSVIGVAADMMGNHVVSMGTGVAFNPAANVSWGAMDIVHNGESITLPLGNVTVSINTDLYVVLDANVTGVGVVERAIGALAPTDTVLAYCRWNSVPGDWTTSPAFSVDARRGPAMNSMQEITVSDTMSDAMFDDLQLAINYAAACINSEINGFPTIRICGELTIATTPIIPTIAIPTGYAIKFVGDRGSCLVKTAAGLLANNHLINCNGTQVTFEDINFSWTSTATQGAYGCIYNPGANSLIERCNFVWAAPASTGFRIPIFAQTAASNIIVQDCTAVGVQESFIVASAGSDDWKVKRCSIDSDGSGTNREAVDINGEYLTVEGCVLEGFADGVVSADNLVVRECEIICKSNASGRGVKCARVTAAGFTKLEVLNSFISTVEYAVESAFATTGTAHTNIVGNTIYNVERALQLAHTAGASTGDSNARFENNSVDTVSEYVVNATYGYDLFINGCAVVHNTGCGVYADAATDLYMGDNHIDGHTSEGANKFMVSCAAQAHITHNTFGNTGVPAGSTCIVLTDTGCRVIGNSISPGSATSIGISMTDCAYSVVADNEVSGGTQALDILPGAAASGIVVRGNIFSQQTVDSVKITKSEGLILQSNYFFGHTGKAVYVYGTLMGGAVLSNNTFLDVVGDGTQSCIMQVDCTDDSFVSITGNTFNGCGNTASTAGEIHSIIYCNKKAMIANNVFTDCKGLIANTDILRVIWARDVSNIIGNTFIQNIGGTETYQPLEMYGIYVDTGDGFIINGNLFNWYGTVAATARTMTCITVIGDDSMVMCNRGGAWVNGAGTDHFIDITGTDNTVIGNNGISGMADSYGTTPKPADTGSAIADLNEYTT
jgi:hypothetical protein